MIYVIEFALFALLDWWMPLYGRSSVHQTLKSDPEIFNVRYRADRPLRLGVGLGLVLLQIAVDFSGNEVLTIAIAIGAFIFYFALVSYCIWCAETGRKLWQ